MWPATTGTGGPRNGTGIESIADLGASASPPVRLHRPLQPAGRAGGERIGPSSDVQLVDHNRRPSWRPGERGDIAAAYSWLPTLEQLEKERQC